MNRLRELESLELIAEAMNEITQSRNGELSYDLLADSLRWNDEFPPDDLRKPIEAFWSMRYVIRYRTNLILGAADEQFHDFWKKAKSLFPNWIGFHPDRCTANPDLAAEYVRMKKEAKDSCDLLQDYE